MGEAAPTEHSPKKIMFLLPHDYKKGPGATAALPAGGRGVAAGGGGGVGITARQDAHVTAVAKNAVSKNLHLDASDVVCVAVHMHLLSPGPLSPTRCFIVKINGSEMSTPYTEDETKKGKEVTIDGRVYLMYSSAHLCALQMLLSKNVCFGFFRPDTPVKTDQIGSAFIQIIVPEGFSQIERHKQDLFSVTSYILRNMFAHFREPSFRAATVTTSVGGILDATKQWLQEDVCDNAPADDDDERFWRPFDIAEYVFHGSHFAYVFPLCYRHIRQALRIKGARLTPRYHETVLKCMPAAFPDFEIPSSLDWYFDHEGQACSLRVLMASDGSPTPEAPPRGAKPGRHKDASTNIFYRNFAEFQRHFFDMIQDLKQQRTCVTGSDASRQVFFCRDEHFSIDSSQEQGKPGRVWLGLGKEETIIGTGRTFCKPVAIKSRQPPHSQEHAPDVPEYDPEIFSRMMRQMKPGSFIASAQEMVLDVRGRGGHVCGPSPMGVATSSPMCREEVVGGGAEAGQREPQAGAAAAGAGVDNSNYWVSEAGICTLYELFEKGVAEDEKSTQSHRRLVKEVRVAIVFHARGCGLCQIIITQPSHTKLLRFFKAWRWVCSSCTSAGLYTPTCRSSTSRSSILHNPQPS